MNIVLGFVGENAEDKFRRLRSAANQHVQADLPLNIASSQDGKAIFGLLQPGGFYPLEKPFYAQVYQYLCMLQGYFWFQSHFPLEEIQAIEGIIKASHELIKTNRITLSEDDGGLFNFVCYDEKTRKSISPMIILEFFPSITQPTMMASTFPHIYA
jgi:hypothetical protein